MLLTFPDKLPIGVPTDSDEHVFTYLATRRQPVDFRAFLVRHFMLWARLHQWTLRVAFPRELHDVIGAYRRAVREELFSPMHPHDSDEFEWYCAERLRREREPSVPAPLPARWRGIASSPRCSSNRGPAPGNAQAHWRVRLTV